MYTRFSPGFVKACAAGELRKGDRMPCPKCGDEDVKFTDPRKWLAIAGAIGIVAAVLFVARLSVPGQIVAIAAVGIAAAALGTESSYACKHCGYIWRFRDAQKWAAAIRHDEESKSKS